MLVYFVLKALEVGSFIFDFSSKVVQDLGGGRILSLYGWMGEMDGADVVLTYVAVAPILIIFQRLVEF